MGDPSCRVSIVSSTLAEGALLINSLADIERISSSKESKEELLTVSSESKEPLYHPWSISNRYYTANIHFALHTTSKVYGAVFEGVPAVIVTWTKGEPFEECMEIVQKALEEHDPEVLLAVRLPASSNNAMTTASGEDAEEDNSAIDAALISYGFEYIDASGPYAPADSKVLRDESESSSDEGVPHLPRVIDALSTIMWPSMSSSNPPSSDSQNPTSRNHETLEAIVNPDPFSILQALEELNAEFDFNDSGLDPLHEDETALYREALGYTDNPSDIAAPGLSSKSKPTTTDWTHGPSRREPLVFDNLEDVLSRFASMTTASPTTDITLSAFNSSLRDRNDIDDDAFGMFTEAYSGGARTKTSLGFDDDFTVYVSPPLEDDVKVLHDDFSNLHLELSDVGSAPPSPSHSYDQLRSSDQALFPESASLYRSLGSTSDLGHVSESESKS